MTNTQNIGSIIVKLMKEEQKLREAYKEAEDWKTGCYNRVLVWEEAYAASGEDEKVGETLDEVYEEYDKANDTMYGIEKRAEAIEEALEALRKAVEATEWLGL